MADYYKHIKDEKLKKLIRAQRIIMWIPLLGSLAAVGIMQYILYKKHPDKIAKFDIAFIAVIAILIGIYFLMKYVFAKILPAGTDAFVYITALVLVSYFAAFIGVQDQIKTVYELQEGIIVLSDEEGAEEILKTDALRKAEAARKAEEEAARRVQKIPKNGIFGGGEEDAAALPPVVGQAPAAKMIRDDTEETLRAALPKRTKNIAGHEDKVFRAIKIYMTPERTWVLSSAGADLNFTLLWIVKEERSRRAEILYTRPLLKKGYTCYFSLTVERGGNKNGMLFKLSEITGSRLFGTCHKKYYQTEEIIKTIAEYLE